MVRIYKEDLYDNSLDHSYLLFLIKYNTKCWALTDIGGSFPFDTDFPWISTFFNENIFLCLVCTDVEVLKAEKEFYSSVSNGFV